MHGTDTCPDFQTMERFLLGYLPDAEGIVLAEHLLTCMRCAARAEQSDEADALVEAMRQAPRVAAELPRGAAVEGVLHRLCGRRPADVAAAGEGPTVPVRERVAQYRIEELLGQGGMGLVYRAEDTTLRRRVALKLMRPEQAFRTTARERFLREARAMASLKHDNLVCVYQAGQEGDQPYLAMEFLQGETLARRLERLGRLPSADVVAIGRQVVAALVAIHAHGLVHRDLKPANIWREAPGGRVKVLDFGLSRSTAEAGVTASGDVVGTPAYMAPEQARGEAADARSDLFSLGCVLYELSAGVPPFAGKNSLALLSALAVETPRPLRELNPEAPPALADLVMSLLEKEPGNRPAAAREVAQRLAAIESGPVSPPRAVGSAPRPRLTWSVLVGLLLFVALPGIGVLFLRPFGGAERATDASAGTSAQVPRTTTVSSFSPRHPDGRPLRNDFALTVKPVGGKLDPARELSLKLGEKIAFQVEVGQDSYVGVFMIGDSGQVLMLFPNADEPESFVTAGKPRTIPGNADYRITADGVSRGPEYVHVFASTHRWEPPAGHRGPDDHYTVYETRSQQEQLQVTLRSLAVERRLGEKTRGDAVSEFVLPFQVRSAP